MEGDSVDSEMAFTPVTSSWNNRNYFWTIILSVNEFLRAAPMPSLSRWCRDEYCFCLSLSGCRSLCGRSASETGCVTLVTGPSLVTATGVPPSHSGSATTSRRSVKCQWPYFLYTFLDLIMVFEVAFKCLRVAGWLVFGPNVTVLQCVVCWCLVLK